MSFINIITVILLGLIGGITNGFTGLSGMGIILAALSLLHIIDDYKTAVGTIVYVLMFPTTLSGAYEYYKQGKINFTIGNILLVCLLIGTYLGSKLSLSSKYKLSEKTIKYTSAFIGLTLAFYFFISAYTIK